MPGDRLIELYAAVHRARRSFNEAVARGQQSLEFRARAQLTELQSSIDYHFREPAPRRRATTYN